ncbi:Six-hairpin glycosidase-like protein [Sporodiniella umbellata]|nr:Six-hairpin glycosidase-like protein [Sporodiniella umbellata]
MLIGYFLVITATFTFYQAVQRSHIFDFKFEQKNELDKWILWQRRLSFNEILKNINPPGTSRGFLAASLSTSNPNYFYTWTRDASLVIQTIHSLPDTKDSLLKDYADFQIKSQETPTVCNCLGEPKFNPDGSAFSGDWSRPQNDGPAERAITFMSIIDKIKIKHTSYVENTMLPALEKDLNYIIQVWDQPCFDLWEEVDGVHFYTLMAMRKSLLDGYKYINKKEYYYTANDIQQKLESFWSPKDNYIKVTQNKKKGVSKPSGLDVSVLLAANKFSYISDGFFSPASDKILATAAALRKSFIKAYPINSNIQQHLEVSIGRYPEDIYDGYDMSQGNPWFLATAAYAELYYRAIQEWKQNGITINSVNALFFEDITHISHGHYAANSDLMQEIMLNVSLVADKFLYTVKYHQQANGSISEQFNRNTGYMQGARDLTWSHAAIISAAEARDAFN